MDEKGGVEQQKSIGVSVIDDTLDYLRSHDGKLNLTKRFNLWSKTKEIDKEVVGGNFNLVDDLVVARNLTSPYSNERDQFDGLIDRYMGMLSANFDTSNDAVSCLLGLYESGSQNQKIFAKHILDDHFGKFENSREVDRRLRANSFGYLLDKCLDNDEVAGKSREILLNQFSTGTGIQEVIDWTLSGVRQKDRKEVMKKINGMVAVFGLEEKVVKDIAMSWSTFYWESEETNLRLFEEMILKNVKTLSDLKGNPEVGNEGIMKLYREYGITHFGRYPAADLFRQLKEENENVPYGLVLSAWSDSNGALIQNNTMEKRKHVELSAAKLGYRIKYVEARSKVTVVRRIKDLARKFPGQKIAFKYIDAHGEPGRVYLGLGNREDDFLTTSDLGKESAKKLKQYYTENCPTLFDSCSTGQEIGPAYSAYGDSYSMAPDKPAYLTRVELRKDTSGKLFFDGAYGSNNEVVETVHSFNGEQAKEKIEKEKEALYEIAYKKMLTTKEGLEAMWGNESIMLGVLKREKLDPLKRQLEAKYGIGNVIQIEEGVDGEESDEGGANNSWMNLELDGNSDGLDWGTGFHEHVGGTCHYLYKKPVGERERSWPVIRVIKDGKVIDRYKIDMSDLWPENIRTKEQ